MLIDDRFCHVPKHHNVIRYRELTLCKFILLETILALSLILLITSYTVHYMQPFEESINDLFFNVCICTSAGSFLLAIFLLFCFTRPNFNSLEESRGALCDFALDMADYFEYGPQASGVRLTNDFWDDLFGPGSRYRSVPSSRNNNLEIGPSRSILRLRNDPTVYEIEFGSNLRSSRVDEVVGVETGGLPSYSEVFSPPSYSQID